MEGADARAPSGTRRCYPAGGACPWPSPPRFAELNDIPPGKSVCVLLGDEKVALFNVDGTVYALSHTCSHRGGPLSEGEVEGTTVTCPWHGASFDLKTGAALGPPAMQGVKRYLVEVEGNDIRLSLS